MMVDRPLDMEKEVGTVLAELTKLIQDSEIIVRYQKIAKQVNAHQGLQAMTEQIKASQQDAVNFAHYNKPHAEKEAVERINCLTKEFDEHPLVIYYRECLVEANDLIQYITRKIEHEINSEVAQRLQEQLLIDKGSEHLATKD